ncbi:MAG: hypothetical protein N2558_00820 [Patescibacteria group bacterium]|nr:hypothetical protein [Patescibacteria group bacterium]
MHTLIVAVAILVVATSSYINFNSKSNLLLDENDIEQEELVLAEYSDDEKQINSEVGNASKSQNVSSPTVSPTKFILPKFENVQESLVYPNAIFVRKFGSVSLYKSNDHPDVILKWYKDFLQQKVLRVNSQVVTKTNDNYLYKLVAVYESNDMSITIRKNADDKYSEIEIED